MHSEKPISNEIRMLKGRALEEGHIKESIKKGHKYERGDSGSLQDIIHKFNNKKVLFLLGEGLFVMLNIKS